MVFDINYHLDKMLYTKNQIYNCFVNNPLFHIFCMSPKGPKRTFLIRGRGVDDV